MDNSLTNIPEIIREASKSPLGIFALIIILLFSVSYGFFVSEDGLLKIIAFTMLFIGAILYGVSIYKTAEKKKKENSPQEGD
ncbi:hypothetical protein [Muricauda sp. MAR_2010_75]|uniref:hypothetical protein n=1 Tax=Allomuricauda sp. MAR_2010_75 TaxID=1250232 RepID=UPI00055C0876|nr:hypothetical protein [Muricauda sp. MAR_2010_75]